jgi:hypothetical protein
MDYLNIGKVMDDGGRGRKYPKAILSSLPGHGAM